MDLGYFLTGVRNWSQMDLVSVSPNTVRYCLKVKPSSLLLHLSFPFVQGILVASSPSYALIYSAQFECHFCACVVSNC